MRDPKTITEQLDGLVTSAEETERGVKDLEELLASDQDLFLPGSLAAEDDEELRAVTPKAATAPPVRLPSPAPASNPPPDRKKVTH
jgi:hypothetical protein